MENDFLFVRFSPVSAVLQNEEEEGGRRKDDDNDHSRELEESVVHVPPEESSEQFRAVEGSIFIDVPFQLVCENLLDMLHISYVHSFGSPMSPLPRSVRSHRLSPLAYRSTFRFVPHRNTISYRVGMAQEVIVENEYHLPTTTVTRVIANHLVKTVLTRCIPISSTRTLLHWKIYRNFWKSDLFPPLSVAGDWVVRLLMRQTLQEDISILRHVDPSFREGPLRVKYDQTIHHFRQDFENHLRKEGGG